MNAKLDIPLNKILLSIEAVANAWQDAIAGRAGRNPMCSYERKRGTEQECSRELWRVIEEEFTDGFPGGGLVIACTLHLPVLMHDQRVREYQLVRIER